MKTLIIAVALLLSFTTACFGEVEPSGDVAPVLVPASVDAGTPAVPAPAPAPVDAGIPAVPAPDASIPAAPVPVVACPDHMAPSAARGLQCRIELPDGTWCCDEAAPKVDAGVPAQCGPDYPIVYSCMPGTEPGCTTCVNGEECCAAEESIERCRKKAER